MRSVDLDRVDPCICSACHPVKLTYLIKTTSVGAEINRLSASKKNNSMIGVDFLLYCTDLRL